MNRKLFVLVAFLCVLALPCGVFAADRYYDGKIKITEGGDLVPITDSAEDIGSSTFQFAEGHFDTIYLGGTAKTSWGSAERQIFLPIGSFTQDSAQLSSATGPRLNVENGVSCVEWVDGETSHIKVTFRVPDDYVSGGLFRLYTDVSEDTEPAEELYLDFNVRINNDGSAASAWDNTPTDETATLVSVWAYGAGAGTPTTINLGPTDMGLDGGDVITLTLWRSETGTHGISTATIEMYYAEFYYTSTQ